MNPNSIDEATVSGYILQTFDKVETSENFGYQFFFYGADHMLPFATLANSDSEYDRVSNLDRPGVYRLNLGVGRETFQSLFGDGKPDLSAYDFTALDTLMPHPDYAAQFFVCVLNPSPATFERVKGLLADAYAVAERRNQRRQPKDEAS